MSPRAPTGPANRSRPWFWKTWLPAQGFGRRYGRRSSTRSARAIPLRASPCCANISRTWISPRFNRPCAHPDAIASPPSPPLSSWREEARPMSLTDRPLHPHFAAEVTGLDMRVPPDASSMRAIVEAADTHAVLVFPGQHIDDAQHVAFSRPFGRLETTIKAYRPGFKGRLDPHVADISNLDENSELLSPTDRRRMNSLDNRLWHTDYTFKETPGLCSLLTARVIPKDGGETEFTGLRAAYDALPERMKLRLRRRPKIDASIGLQPPLVMVRLDRTIGRGTVPLRMVRSSRTMTWKGRRRDS
ncbi:MAG: hypothetical protein EXR07_21745, partial [Acetobacteraceae bacterium]|nr:hypothetical protein [Acetobacteraceae bacterium]